MYHERFRMRGLRAHGIEPRAWVLMTSGVKGSGFMREPPFTVYGYGSSQTAREVNPIDALRKGRPKRSAANTPKPRMFFNLLCSQTQLLRVQLRYD